MSEQEFLSKSTTHSDVEDQEALNAAKPIDISDLLDQIDGVLEKNAQEFVDNFVQKGGQ
jgi:ubiquitin-like protein Pup